MSDVMTGIPGRDAFLIQIEIAMDVGATPRRRMGVAVVHLSRLHEIIRTYSYRTADALVADFIQRTRTILRPQDTLFRLGDSDIGLLLPGLVDPPHLELAVTRLSELHREKYLVDGVHHNIGAIVGAALFPDDGEQAEELVQAALGALHHAQSARLRFACYDRSLVTLRKQAFLLENRLANAIENSELNMCYQPKISLKTGQATGIEALLRWHCEDSQPVSPQFFIPVAERSGLIVDLTVWTFNCSMRQSRALLARTPHLKLAVNLSAVVLDEPHLIELIQRCLRTWDFPPQNLILEITESAVMTDPERSAATLEGLRQMGIVISIDDFGTGYSSLAYLRRLPVGELKIDKSFIFNMAANREDESIVQAVIDLSHNFGLSVVAEGVEDRYSLERLMAMGADAVQGFYFTRPLPMSELQQWLHSNLPAALAEKAAQT